MSAIKNIIKKIYYTLNPAMKKMDRMEKLLENKLLPQYRGFDETITIIDMDGFWGPNFKEYFITENMPERIALLKKDLDKKSIEVVDNKIEHFLNFPLSKKYIGHFRVDTKDILYTKEELIEAETYRKNRDKILEKYSGDFNGMSPEIFYYHHGLKLLPETALDYIKGRDFLDIGAFLGDSSVVFNEYSPSKVYAFEILDVKERYYSNLKANNIEISKYEFISKGVSKEHGKIKLEKSDSINTETIIKNSDTDNFSMSDNKREVEIVKLDDYFKDNKNIGLIKIDIEGAEYDAILGLENIIKNQTPLMLLSIYHTPKEFFELKPLIEKMNPNYKFIIRNLHLDNADHMETTLICIPKSIEE